MSTCETRHASSIVMPHLGILLSYNDMLLLLPQLLLLGCSSPTVTAFSPLNDDPNIYLTTPQIISRYGYPSEIHRVETADGYLLSMHRIPHGRNNRNSHRPVVFLLHGLPGNSADWVIAGPGRSLAFQLADNGYDVWLGNVRGNDYCRFHVTLRTVDPQFWKFSWDEMAAIDLPAMISYTLEATGQPTLSYIGHSMGSTIFFAAAAEMDDLQKKIDVMIGMSPVAYVSHIKKSIRNMIPWVLPRVALGSEMPHVDIIRDLVLKICTSNNVSLYICTLVLFHEVLGSDIEQIDETLTPALLSHIQFQPSSMTLIHYAQLVLSGRFCKFDYGENNMIMYNTMAPPDYDLRRIRTPVVLMTAASDVFADEHDVEMLKRQLTNVVGHYVVPDPKFGHVDFLFAKDATTLVYNQLLSELQRHSDFNNIIGRIVQKVFNIVDGS